MKEQLFSKIAYLWAVATGLFGSIDLNKAAVLVGILATIFTAGVNFYYRRKTFELQEDEAERDE
ncbi:MAG: hypothetical protein CENE_03814 [Candidatus Celerinatantimonas neptuna]|nr:MAG: hypothetical protein CENE_03814 [Candidatus Celerinatantimonas neptuna]